MSNDDEQILVAFFAKKGRLFLNEYDVPAWLRQELIVGYRVELEHGRADKKLNVSDDDTEVTIKIALAHLKEAPDYYTRLKKMEEDADAYWSTRRDAFSAKHAEVLKLVDTI